MQRRFRFTFGNGTQPEKRTIAGALGGAAIFAGEYHMRMVERREPNDSNWTVNKTGAESYFVPALKLTKTHGGSW